MADGTQRRLAAIVSADVVGYSRLMGTDETGNLWALERQQEMFQYPDEGYQKVFLRPDIAIRRARKIFMSMQREETSVLDTEAAE